MKKNILGLTIFLFSALAFGAPKAVNKIIPSAKSLKLSKALLPAFSDNVGYGMLGSWYDPATSGQGYDIQYFTDSSGVEQIVFYWYTYNASRTQKEWFLAQGPLDDPIHMVANNLPVYHVTGGSFLNPADVPNAQQVGYLTFRLYDCNNANITFNFYSYFDEFGPLDGTAYNDYGFGYGNGIDVQRLTPIVTVRGYDLCSTPISMIQ